MVPFKIVFLVSTTISLIQCINLNPGVQMRLTKKGMNYAVEVGIKIMKEDLKGKEINEKGSSGSIKYSLSNLLISKIEFQSYELIPIAGTGMEGSVSGISINAAGKLWYRVKKGWFSYSDTIGISISAEDIHFKMTLDVGADKNGRPTIGVKKCSAGVGNIDLHFSGGGGWIYNIFSGLIEKKMESVLGNLLCSMATKEINTKAKSELATFPVNKAIDKWAQIDYALIKSPSFTGNYMDSYLKGEFKSRKQPVESSLTVPSFPTSTEHDKMVYFWITDYTLNTAAEVYHKAGRLSASYSAWDKKTPSVVREYLNTDKFAILIPAIAKRYTNAPMSFDVYSYKAPKVIIQENKLNIFLYAHGMFKAKDKNLKLNNLFSLKFDITATGTVGAKDNNVVAKITTFDYDAKVDKSYIGTFSIPIDSPFIKSLIDVAVISQANPTLQKGFPLPKVDEVSLKNFDVQLEKEVIRIGSDVQYVHEK